MAAVEEVGDGIKLGTFRSPGGDVFGLIENPVFKLQPAPARKAKAPAAEPPPHPSRWPD